jgi:transcriptional regulator with XRE-family HTH domain
MNKIKEFREKYGMSLLQLAHFTGKTAKYISVQETRNSLPSDFAAIIRELETEFEEAVNENDEISNPAELVHSNELLSKLVLQIQQNEDLLLRFLNKLNKLKKKRRNLSVIQLVSSNWKAKKLDTDPDILVKMGPIESGIKVEILRCGPAAQSKIRLKMARVQAEIESAKEEIVKISPCTSL